MKRLFSLALLVTLTTWAFANNISVSNVSLTGQNVAAGANNAANFTQIQFTVSWENSHRTSFGPSNWDAAWVFVKYRTNGSTWLHARLNTAGTVVPTGSTIDIALQTPGTAYNASTNPGMGAFIYRNAVGTGTFTASNCQLRWNYGSQGVTDNSAVEIQVYAVETIYVPQAAFNAGGGGGGFTSTTISTAVASTLPTGTGTLGGAAGGIPTGQNAPVANWPNGFSAFYCMKYEISQQQYVDFLNNLTAAQATTRYPASTGNRHGITVASGVYSTTFPAVACNFLSWTDLIAYLDWAGLRPMTELEYEKAARGPVAAVTGEFAWGTITATGATGITNAGLPSEIATNTTANAAFGNAAAVQGPLRVGAFAGAATTRAQAGASYYGIMELSGNLVERTVTVGNPQGRSFTPVNGDGILTSAGDANSLTWPTTALGSGLRGGSWVSSNNTFLRISDRTDALTALTTRLNYLCGRGVRSAP